MANKKRIFLNLHNKLALREASQTSKALLTLFHIGLIFNWIFVYSNLYPVIAILPLVLILLYEQVKKTPFTKSALQFAWKRLILHAIIISGTAIYGILVGLEQNAIIQAYILQSYILVPLAGYDAYHTYKGGLGLELLRPLKEKIRKIRG